MSDLRHLFVRPERQAQARNRVEAEACEMSPSGEVLRLRARVVGVLELYHRKGQVEWRQAEAGKRLRVSWELGVCGARDSEAGIGGAGPGGYADSRIDALTDYRTAMATVPPRIHFVVSAVCLEDIPVADLAREGHGNVTSLMALLRIALSTMADHWRLDDGP